MDNKFIIGEYYIHTRVGTIIYITRVVWSTLYGNSVHYRVVREDGSRSALDWSGCFMRNSPRANNLKPYPKLKGVLYEEGNK